MPPLNGHESVVAYLIQEGANLNELCGCSCPHVLNICEEGVRRASSLPGLVGVQLTVEMLRERSSCELLLWADRDSHPIFTSAPRQRGIAVTLHDGDSAAAPQITDSGVASGSRMLVKLDFVAELMDAVSYYFTRNDKCWTVTITK